MAFFFIVASSHHKVCTNIPDRTFQFQLLLVSRNVSHFQSNWDLRLRLSLLFFIFSFTDAALGPYTPRHDFNPMDCTDMVIGMARGTASRIWDYYTRDR